MKLDLFLVKSLKLNSILIWNIFSSCLDEQRSPDHDRPFSRVQRTRTKVMTRARIKWKPSARTRTRTPLSAAVGHILGLGRGFGHTPA